MVNVSPRTHPSATLRLDDLELEGDYDPAAAYAHSKLVIVRWDGHGVADDGIATTTATRGS